MNAVAIACSRATNCANSGPRSMRRRRRTLTVHAKPRLSQALNDVFLVMLLTAQRCGEVCQMQWREVDLDTGWWLIPGDVSKNHDPHRVPLTSMVLEILDRRARAENADDRWYNKEKRVALEKWIEVLSGIVDVKPAPTTAPAKRTQRQNVYQFQPRALRRAGDRAREDVGCAPTQSA